MSVHVVPVFEYNTTIQAPTSKVELLKAIYSRKAVFFHHFKAPECHRIPDAAKWLQRPDDGAISVFTTTRWLQPCWEPVYVARVHETPLYNESFIGYGKNKIQQVRLLAFETIHLVCRSTRCVVLTTHSTYSTASTCCTKTSRLCDRVTTNASTTSLLRTRDGTRTSYDCSTLSIPTRARDVSD